MVHLCSFLLRRIGFVAAFALALAIGAAAAQSARPLLLHRLAPPPDGQTYFGFTFRLWDSTDPLWGDTRPFKTRIADSIQNELAGKRPTFLTVYAPWRNQDGTPAMFNNLRSYIAKVRTVEGGRRLLYLDWTFVATGDPKTYSGITTHTVASGKLDRYIRAYARQIKAYRGPVLIRLFGGEFNGRWWVSVSPLANPALTTADFVNAWRRVVRIFRQVGALNVSWAWIPNAFPSGQAGYVDSSIAAYYPGNAYVDWAGADLYDYASPSWLDGPYAFARAHRKPFFLAEWGVRHGSSTLTPMQDQAWLSSMFDYFQSHVAVKAIAYFDYKADASSSLDGHVFLDGGKVNYAPNVDDFDHRLVAESGANFRETFSARISSQRYISSIRTVAIRANP